MSYGSSKTALTKDANPRDGFWSNRTKMEKNLIMLIGALFLVTFGLMVAVGLFAHSSHQKEKVLNSDTASVLLNGNHANVNIPIRSEIKAFYRSDSIFGNSNDNKNENPSDICNTTACQVAGKLIRDAINSSVDPCDDFYEFACGGWVATHTIPKDLSTYGNFDDLDEKLQNSLKKELSEPTKKTDSVAVVYASDLYKACIDNATLESRGVSPLIATLNSIGGWPIIGHSSVYSDSTYDWKDALARVVGHLDLSFLFFITVQPDSNETLVNRIYFDTPRRFGLGRNQLVNTSAYPDIVNAYKKFMLETALLLGAKNDSQTHKDIEDMLNFESELATLSTPPEERRDAKVWYNRMTFKDFNALTSNTVDWLDITNRVYKAVNSTIRLSSNELVIIEDIPYYKSATKLLANTPPRVIANYFGWLTAMILGDYTVKKFRYIKFQFGKVNEGVEEEAELWRACVNYLENTLKFAVSRKYVDENFTEKDKKEATLMVKDVKESFRALVEESDWLDDITKNKSLHKLNTIIENVGYPEWILNNQNLDDYYGLKQKVDPKKALESILYIQMNSALNKFEMVRKPVNRTMSWLMPPAIVNAVYSGTQNSITIPAGILKLPFFDSQRPSYMNYGAIGLVIGHELTHGFDDQGSQYDETGNLINWWSNQTRQRFNERSDCFIKEYSSYYDSEAGMHLNGENTVGENIADNGGLREAFKAYKLYVERHGEPQRLPYISQYSPEQIFFLSYAYTWCSITRSETLKLAIQYNPHSPAKYRVNVPFTNFKAFSDVYNCKENSRMNPKNKCVLW